MDNMMDKRYENKIAEKNIQDMWEKEQTYCATNNPGKLYSIDTPPPTVSGSLHIGHVFSYTQTDIIARHKRMSGYSVFYPFGFDDNGLPTEKFVEKKLKITAGRTDRKEFTQKCLEVAHEAEKDFKTLWQQMGLSIDWNLCYSTISDDVKKVSQESFITLYNKGFIYRKNEPSLFCTTCRTSISQADLEDEEKDSFFNDIIFKTEEGQDILIATTRPELLPSCVAVLYNPKDIRYKKLKNKKAIVPVFGQSVTIMEDEDVQIDKGTGLVMVCTFGDKTDTVWFKKFDLPYVQSIDLGGKFLPHVPLLAGLKVPEAREAILQELDKLGLLVNKKPIKHPVNVHDRCKKEIEIIALEQWFIKILDHKNKFLELADKIEWHPAFMKSRYVDWVKNISWDWCISRQRFSGIPFPVWHCQDCGQTLLANIKDLPIDPQETSYPGKTCNKCTSTNIKPDTDIMDTWNTSSITPYIAYTYFNKENSTPFEKNSDFLPMGMRPQAHDIIRTWAFYTIVKTWMHNKTIPWQSIVISGHVLSESKDKISKSAGNTSTEPFALIQNFSADAIRYWTASGGLGKDISFSESQIKIGQKLVTKIWNAFIFVQGHVADIDSLDKNNKIDIVNEWILDQASTCFDNYNKNLNQYEFGLALQQIDKFFWSDFCDNYLELIKDQLFNPDNYDKAQVNYTKNTLYYIGLRILQMYATYIPHVTESIYQAIYRQHEQVTSLHQTKFEKIQAKKSFPESSKQMGYILDIVEQVRKLKSTSQLSLKTEIDSLEIYSLNQNLLHTLANNEQLIRGITKSHIVELKNETIEESRLDKIGDRIKTAIKIDIK